MAAGGQGDLDYGLLRLKYTKGGRNRVQCAVILELQRALAPSSSPCPQREARATADRRIDAI
eukprot:SAG22_NODE_154_length_17189_cov_38.210064_15_plen_62_part_00